jgi:hypothetical protein
MVGVAHNITLELHNPPYILLNATTCTYIDICLYTFSDSTLLLRVIESIWFMSSTLWCINILGDEDNVQEQNKNFQC